MLRSSLSEMSNWNPRVYLLGLAYDHSRWGLQPFGNEHWNGKHRFCVYAFHVILENDFITLFRRSRPQRFVFSWNRFGSNRYITRQSVNKLSFLICITVAAFTTFYANFVVFAALKMYTKLWRISPLYIIPMFAAS